MDKLIMDWKIVGASVVAVLLISGLFLSNTEVGGFVSSIVDRLRDWLGRSPFEGLFSAPPTESKEVSVRLSAPEISMKPESPVNITSQSAQFLNFQGRLVVDFVKGNLELEASVSPFKADIKLDEYVIAGLYFPSMVFENIQFDIQSHMKSENGSVEVTDFVGSAKILFDSVLLEGKASQLKVRTGELEWELK